MTLEITHRNRRQRALPRLAAMESLRQLPPRLPVDPPEASASIRWDLIDLDRYEVSSAGRTIGFIDVVGAVFVVLAGPRYARAVEISQTLVFDDAIEALKHTALAR